MVQLAQSHLVIGRQNRCLFIYFLERSMTDLQLSSDARDFARDLCCLRKPCQRAEIIHVVVVFRTLPPEV